LSAANTKLQLVPTSAAAE